MVKLIWKFEMDDEKLKESIDEYCEEVDEEHPASVDLIGDWINDHVNDPEELKELLQDLKSVELTQIVFEDEEERDSLKDWLKEEGEEEDGED